MYFKKRLVIITENTNIKYTEELKESLLELVIQLINEKEVNSLHVGPIKNKEITEIFINLFKGSCYNELQKHNRIPCHLYTIEYKKLELCVYETIKTMPADIKYKLNELLNIGSFFIFLKESKIGLKRNSNYIARKLQKCSDRNYYIIDQEGTIYRKGKKLIN